MHIKHIENSVNAIKCPNEPRKITKKWHNTPVVKYWHEKKIESNKRHLISFRPQRWHAPHGNNKTCCEKLWFVRTLYPNLPQMGQIFYHGMLMPLHDSMPSFINFGRVLDLLEFKNQVSQCLRPSDGGRVLKFIPISCMGPKHAPRDTYLIFQPVYMHWRMCM